jgi:glutamate--cysteine ligase catalytic subunit
MGFLSEGTTLDWPEAKKYADKIRQEGITQFLNIYNRTKDRQNDCLLWGDEV